MLGNTGQQEHQDRLLKSLQHKVSLSEMPQPKLQVQPIKASIFRSGRGTIDDHMMLMKNYVCQCGRTFSEMTHSTSSKTNGTAFDTYSMDCGNCGDHEEVSFMSMKRTLQEANQVNGTIDRKNKRLFPYL